jgi:hypothetical protein
VSGNPEDRPLLETDIECSMLADKTPIQEQFVSYLEQSMDLRALADFNLVATHGGLGRAFPDQRF